MKMNRLRNVAVRMRPPDSAKKDDVSIARSTADTPPTSQPATPRRVVVSRPDANAKRQIWDLEPDDSPAISAPRAPSEVAAVSKPSVHSQPKPNATPSAADQAPDRAKTRIIGFHAEEITPGLSEAPDEGPAYPAGFLVVIDGPGTGAHFVVTTRVSTIGRGDDQDISLDFGDESISRSGHASVMYDAEHNRFFLGHGNKANAVRRNDMPVLATEEMAHGDDIRIGKTTLRFHAFCGPDFTWEGQEHD